MDTAQNSQPQLTEAMQYRLLLERILTPRMDERRERKQLAEIVPGAVPTALPFDLPVPTPQRMIGSLMMALESEDHPANDARIYFDAPLPAATIFAFYAAHLLGWSEDVPFAYRNTHGGFEGKPAIDGEMRAFAHPQHGTLTVMVIAATGKPTEVNLVWEDRVPPPRAGLPPQPVPPQIFPRLLPPAQALTAHASSTNNLHEYHAIATIETEKPLPLAAVLTHYGEQLRVAGWEFDEESAHTLLAWSQWSFHTAEGKTWRGLLIVAASVTPNLFRVSFTSE